MKTTHQIVIVEDDADLNSGLCKALKEEGRNIVSCENLRSAREQIFLSVPSLVILDINLPDGNGLALLKEIKEAGLKTRVILLSANDTDADVVKGLELEADDYVTKPFSLSVLRARVNTQLRKDSAAKESDAVTIGSYHFDFDKMSFYAGEEQIILSKTEQKLLKIFVSNRGVTLSRDNLVDRVWTDGFEYVSFK